MNIGKRIEKTGPTISNILHPTLVKELVKRWLEEDTSGFDLAAIALSSTQKATAFIQVKEAAILAGSPFVDALFQELDCTVTWQAREGQILEAFDKIAKVVGLPRNLLLGERVALNCLARACGVATLSRSVKNDLNFLEHFRGEVCGTRKTTPGFRMVEKYAMLVGGIGSHRYDLSGMIMLKDNHIRLSGSIREAVTLAKQVGGFHQKVEVECSGLKEALEAAESGCDVVMLDNLEPSDVHKTAAKIKELYPKLLIEASGGIDIRNIKDYAGKNVDVISSSMFVQGYKTIDLSMKICP